MNKPIISIPEEKYFLDSDIQKWILENCSGIVFGGSREGLMFFVQHREKLKNSFDLNASVLAGIIPPYIDEAICSPTKDNQNYKQIIKDYPNTLAGEPDLDAIDGLVRLGCNNITLTRYNDYIKIFGCRIGLWWTNQIGLLKQLNQKYPNKLNYVFLSLTANSMSDWKLISAWCRENGKRLIIYVAIGTNEQKIVELLNKFNEMIK